MHESQEKEGGSSSAERQEFESLKEDTIKKEYELKETGMSEGQMNEEESIVAMVTRMHESQEKEGLGCLEAAKSNKKPQCFESGKASMPSNSDDSFSESTTASPKRDLQTTGDTVAKPLREEYCDSGRLPTGLVHAMGIEHSSTGDRPHPECKERVCAILTAFEQEGLRSRCEELDLRSARREELERAHDRAHVQNMARVSNMASQELEDLADTLDSVYLTTGSFRCASDASGAVIELVEKVVYGELSNGFAVVRPPGHHAESNEACGFCVFNHVAVAAEAIKSFGVGRVLIVDWDIHHGNGTQQIFESDPDVLVFNIHRYDNAQFFPCSKAASPDMVGKDPAEGLNVNVAWNVGRGDYEGMGDDEYLAAWRCALLPIAFEFQPEFILISAGFDATEGDPLGGCSVTPALYAQLTRMLQTICPNVVLVLEGGYNLSATAECAVACARALLGDPVPFRTSCQPKKEAKEALRLVLSAHRPFWSYLPDSFVLRDSAIPVTETAAFASALHKRTRWETTKSKVHARKTCIAGHLSIEQQQGQALGQKARLIRASILFSRCSLLGCAVRRVSGPRVSRCTGCLSNHSGRTAAQTELEDC